MSGKTFSMWRKAQEQLSFRILSLANPRKLGAMQLLVPPLSFFKLLLEIRLDERQQLIFMGLTVREVTQSPAVVLVMAYTCAAVSVAGFVSLAQRFGTLNYSLTGYHVVWGPFLALFCGISLFVVYFVLRAIR